MSFPTAISRTVQRRVEEVLTFLHCQRRCSVMEGKLLLLLRERVGKHDAMPLIAITENLGISDRTVKGMVSDLRKDFGLQIGASRDGDHGGYYLVATEDEQRESTQQLVNQAIAMLRTVHSMRGRGVMAEILGQIRIELGMGEEVRRGHL